MAQPAESEKIVAASNTGPLISAFQCGRADLLSRYFSMIYITGSELAELDKHGWADEIQRLMNTGLVIVIDLLAEAEKKEAERLAKRIALNPASRDQDWRNHLPEAEAMALMQRRGHLVIEMILLDEKAARNVAQEQGLLFTGFPGLLGRAGLDGLLTKDEIRRLLKTCRKQGTHYSGALIETVAQFYGR